MSFLPRDYQAPRTDSNYLKLEQGETKFRVLTPPIMGWEDWINEKPVRYRMDDKPDRANDPKKKIKHFWAFVVWDYKEMAIKILNVTQGSVRQKIEDLCKDADWGSPFTYDLKVTRKGEGLKTEYSVSPLPHKEIAEHVIDAFRDKPCNLEALFQGEDPFAAEWNDKKNAQLIDFLATQEKVTPVKTTVVKNKQGVISVEQFEEISNVLEQADDDARSKWIDRIYAGLKISSLGQLPADQYEKALAGASGLKKTTLAMEKSIFDTAGE